MVATVYTVFFIDRNTSLAMAEYRFLFRPFELSEEVAFCNWNAYGTTVESAIPELHDLLKKRREYRAIILNADALLDDASLPRPDEKNPFDYSKADPENGPRESPIPIIRLTHMLAGYERFPKREFEPGVEFFDESSHETKQLTLAQYQAQCREEAEISDEILSHDDDSPIKQTFKSVFIEKKPSKDILDRHKQLFEKYQLDDPRPKEIILIALKKYYPDEEKEQIHDAWTVPFETMSSTFWERNRYPECCRFLYANIDAKDALRAERDQTAFWFSVVALSTNRIPPAFLQAYRLYRIDVEVDVDKLSEQLNHHVALLDKARERIVGELEKELKPSLPKSDCIVEPQIISINVENDDAKDAMKALESDDKSAIQKGSIEDQVETRKRFINDYSRDARRAIDRAAQYLRQRVRNYAGIRYELDAVQYETLLEEIADLEKKVLSSRPHNRYDREKTERTVADIERNLKSKLGKEISMNARKMAFVVVAVIVMIGFFPYIRGIYELYTTKDGVLIGAILVSIFVVILTLIGGYFALKIHVDKEKQLANAILSKANEITQSRAQTQEDYQSFFTGICTLMYANSVLKGTVICEDSAAQMKRKLHEHLKAADFARERDIHWLMAYEQQPDTKDIVAILDDFSIEIPPIDNNLYYLDHDINDDLIQINQSGETIVAPYRFIRRLCIERIDLFDDEGIK